MRISDWSSDVCSSDLHARAARLAEGLRGLPGLVVSAQCTNMVFIEVPTPATALPLQSQPAPDDVALHFGGAGVEDRKSDVWGQSVSLRVDLGGRRNL